MQRADEALAFADIIALAALADGVATPTELTTLGHALEEFAEGSITTDECVKRWHSLAENHDSLDKLARYIRYTKMRLTPDDRIAALSIIAGLAAEGSGILDPRLGGYRNTYRASPEALLALFNAELSETSKQ